MTGTVRGEAQGYRGGRHTGGGCTGSPSLWAPPGFPQELAKRAQPGDCRCHCQEENVLDFRDPPDMSSSTADRGSRKKPGIPRDPCFQPKKAGGLSSLHPNGSSLLPLAWATLRCPKALLSPPRPASSKPLSTLLPE